MDWGYGLMNRKVGGTLLILHVKKIKHADEWVRINIPALKCRNSKNTFTELFSAGLREQFLFQTIVAPFFGHELFVGPFFYYGSLLDEDDVICLLHSLQLMSPPGQSGRSMLHFNIQFAGGLVQYDDLRLPDQSSDDGQALLLSV
ncbi:hypothetical protein F7725_014643 [Dissostichus mawsoni]|uniref:Uncharacterized protein n=1 Tax=Dissostichus mawsoni TaxID=36200 RepID=A0A7J5YWQ9_DISMA|nr:hypothetical protein F7725_014643 [Dissostichus mawsoni]